MRVTINGKNAPLSFISPSQVNILTPEDDQTGIVTITLTNTLGTTSSTITRAPITPAFFTFTPEQDRYVASVHTDGAYNAKPGLFGREVTTVPARPGETLLFFATGLGPTTPPVPTSTLVGTPAPLANQIGVTIGGRTADVRFAGLISPGLYQLNVVIPDLPDGDHPIAATTNGQTTPTRYVAVQH